MLHKIDGIINRFNLSVCEFTANYLGSGCSSLILHNCGIICFLRLVMFICTF